MPQATNTARIGARSVLCDCQAIEDRLTALEDAQCDCTAIEAAITNINNDITSIQNTLTTVQQSITNIEQQITTMETYFNDQITNIWNEISYIRDFIYLSDVRTFPTSNTLINGVSVSVINAGHTFNFWGSGATNQMFSLGNNTNYYIIQQSQIPFMIPELAWYQGDSTIGTLWLELAGGGAVYSFPLRFDSTGIYFTTTQSVNNVPVGSMFKFTQALILVDPSAGVPPTP
ncbi:MAG: hypothetical protein FWD76_05830 [Firmicutes bacterium]|nr:hypothetical protein [Bacillota bacterium]